MGTGGTSTSMGNSCLFSFGRVAPPLCSEWLTTALGPLPGALSSLVEPDILHFKEAHPQARRDQTDLLIERRCHQKSKSTNMPPQEQPASGGRRQPECGPSGEKTEGSEGLRCLARAQWEAPCALSAISHTRDLDLPSANIETGLGVCILW